MGNTPVLADLCGARVVVAGEPDARVKLSVEHQVNHGRGRDHPLSFVPRVKVWLRANPKPEIGAQCRHMET
jgi:hypothetical protein